MNRTKQTDMIASNFLWGKYLRHAIQALFLIWLAISSVEALAQTSTAYLVGQSTNTGANSGTAVSITVPTQVALGDLLLAQVAAVGLTNCSQITLPAGWATVNCTLSSGNITQGIYSKTATATDAGTSPTWTLSSNRYFAANMVAYRYWGSIDVSAGQANGNSGTATAPAVTTTAAADVVVAFFASAYATTITPSTTINVEAGTATSNGGGGGASAVIADYLQSTAGSTGTQTASLGNNARSIGTQVAIKSASSTQACNPPPTVVAALGPISTGGYTCYCDNFDRTTLSPSPIFTSPWLTSSSNGTFGNPRIVAPGRLRLTDNTGDNASAATAPGIYPAAGNYISVEFNHYAYNGSGADGVAVTLSDSSIPAVPGGYGGSQGYAPEGTPGFAGGWLGVALDEYGNYSNPTEGRTGGPGFIPEQVGMRGPGSGTNGYVWIAGSGGSPGGLSIDNHTSLAPSTGYMYQVIVDARNESAGTVNVSVNRDSTTMNGATYSSIVSPVNVYSSAVTAQSSGWITQIVPNYWQISFTSSTGGSTNIHEIGGLRVCAQTSYPPTGQAASEFSAIDTGYGSSAPAYQNFQTGDIYMKLVGTPFQLWLAALTSTGISTAYSATQSKYVLVNLVPNITTSNACTPSVCSSACTIQNPVESTGVGNGGSQVASFPTSAQGVVLTPSFTLNSAHQNLIAVMKECTTSACTSFTSTPPACSSDAFSVRPLSVASVVSSNATNSGTSGAPTFAAASGNFYLTATTTGVAGYASGYTGTLRVNNSAVLPVSPATNAGVLASVPATAAITFPAATSSTGSSTTTGTFTYSEVGGFVLPGYDPSTDTTSLRGVYDGVTTSTDCTGTVAACDSLKQQTTWTWVDSISTKNDCNANSYSNSKDGNGKYGCNFGNLANTATIGRFIPAYFNLTSATVVNRSDLTNSVSVNGGIGPGPASSFTYLGEPLQVQFTLTAENALGNPTLNYFGSLSQFTSSVSGVGTGANGLGLWGFGSGYTVGTGTCNAMLAHTATAGSYPTSFANCLGGAVAPTSIACLTSGPNCGATSARITTSTPSFTPFASGVSTFTTNLTVGRADLPDGPYSTFEIGAAPTDGDGVTLAPSALNVDTDTSGIGTSQRQLLGSEPLFYGRLKLTNAYGSELLPLWVPVTAQYIKGFTSVSPSLSGPIFVTNTVDNATNFSPKSNLSIGDYTGTLSASNLTVAGNISSNLYNVGTGSISSALARGLANIEVQPPTAGPSIPTGSAFIALTLGSANTNENCVLPALANATSGASLSYLQWGWCTGKLDPNALITFGMPVNRYIYLRENY